ncbi:hypothetical protein XBO1_1790002 [Xenorhabdus bovienii str. oregonense]|uniref:Uncharacterized protein n=1 Tax=Xenorhabdus bovienii str. oregonense TaxID=1398202 RepID=A0A077P2E3_XENBV|nr:hypothetical protein XBO1_1790002 [Xenorhabdus bovienii str. oregonense]
MNRIRKMCDFNLISIMCCSFFILLINGDNYVDNYRYSRVINYK